jgi:hypothetical protein
MKHHFGDLLDRTGDYWTIVPNRERYAYSADSDIADKGSVKILTVSKNHANWEQVFECANIEELTLHDPSKEQVETIRQLKSLKRLRVTFFRAKDIEFVGNLCNLEEVILEYVSGFSDLSPLRKLTKLKSLHLENLRRISNFDGLKGIDSLRYLHIDGTVDWKQPIDDFTFLAGTPNIEVLSLRFIKSKAEFPAFWPLLNLKKLRKIRIGRSTFKTNEYAFLQVALPNVEGCSWDLCWDYRDNLEFLGQRAGFVKKSNPNAKACCDEFIELYNKLKRESEQIIESYRSSNL